jgi:RNA recognition motif-containing protein
VSAVVDPLAFIKKGLAIKESRLARASGADPSSLKSAGKADKKRGAPEAQAAEEPERGQKKQKKSEGTFAEGSGPGGPKAGPAADSSAAPATVAPIDPASSNKTVFFLGNLEKETPRKALVDFLSSHGIQFKSARMLLNEKTRAALGCGKVEVLAEYVEKLASLDGQILNGRPCRVQRALSGSEKKRLQKLKAQRQKEEAEKSEKAEEAAATKKKPKAAKPAQVKGSNAVPIGKKT